MPVLHLCHHGKESNVPPDAKANHTVKQRGKKKKWQNRTSAVVCSMLLHLLHNNGVAALLQEQVWGRIMKQAPAKPNTM